MLIWDLQIEPGDGGGSGMKSVCVCMWEGGQKKNSRPKLPQVFSPDERPGSGLDKRARSQGVGANRL